MQRAGVHAGARAVGNDRGTHLASHRDDFHDILPGSGIAANYVDAERNLEDVGRTASAVLNESLAEIAARIDSRGPGVPVVVGAERRSAWVRAERPVSVRFGEGGHPIRVGRTAVQFGRTRRTGR